MTRKYVWNMGTRCVLNHNQVHTVREIQADGKELRWIASERSMRPLKLS